MSDPKDPFTPRRMSPEARQLYAEATTPGPLTWWWLSFADATRPKGQQNLGVAIVKATCSADAMRVSWRTGCNPGGEVMSVRVPEGKGDPPIAWQHKLVSGRAAIDVVNQEWFGEKVSTLGELEDERG